MRRLVILLLGFGLLVLLCGSILNFFSFSIPSANQILLEKTSPNGKLKAVIFTRDCGATTANSRQVSIISTSQNLPNESGNVFVAGDEPALKVNWEGDKNLTISGGGDTSPFPVSGFPGIQVTYH